MIAISSCMSTLCVSLKQSSVLVLFFSTQRKDSFKIILKENFSEGGVLTLSNGSPCDQKRRLSWVLKEAEAPRPQLARASYVLYGTITDTCRNPLLSSFPHLLPKNLSRFSSLMGLWTFFFF